ncbi:MAG: hypothetical protein BHW14_07685 [Coprococcus sp. 43_8]|nr:MAG: hypothetical protein BHW14_07685 [Coprococcus sp. 43_8]
MDVIKEKWEEIIQKLKVEYFLSNISFETWIRPLEVYEIRGNTLYLTVNFKASIEHIQNKYLLPLKQLIDNKQTLKETINLAKGRGIL